MPYLVFRGSIMLVTKPDGQVVRHTCNRDTVFLDAEKVVAGQPYQFQKDGYKLVINTADVKEIVFTCDNCGRVMEKDGLCEDCKKLPRLLEPGRKR